MKVEIKKLSEIRLATVRHVGAYDRISEAFGRLCDIAGPAGLLERPGTQMIALYHDEPSATPVEKLRSDAGLTLPAEAQVPKGLVEQRIPAGEYATVVHVGPYERLPDAWAQLKGEWLPASGRRMVPRGPSYEVYLNDPMTTEKEKLETEIRVRVG